MNITSACNKAPFRIMKIHAKQWCASEATKYEFKNVPENGAITSIKLCFDWQLEC